LLKRALDEVEKGFVRALDGYSLADVVFRNLPRPVAGSNALQLRRYSHAIARAESRHGIRVPAVLAGTLKTADK
jgi:hypothetical protein